jgi:hypothetical protein
MLDLAKYSLTQLAFGVAIITLSLFLLCFVRFESSQHKVEI